MKSLSYCLVASLAFIAPSLSAHASSEVEDKNAELRVESGDTDLSDVGDIDVNWACRSQQGALSTWLLPPPKNVFSWQCTQPGDFSGSTPKGPPVSMDMDRACRTQHGSGAFALYSDFKNPRSWRCYTY